MTDFRKLSDSMLASPQIGPDDVAAAAAGGVTLIINNRPDGEASDAPQGAEIEAAARAAGIGYCAIPVSPGGFSEAQVAAMEQAIEQALARPQGKVLAYCRTGTRSTLLWALAQAHTGANLDSIAVAAGAAGYDLAPVRGAMEALSARAKR